MKVTTVYPYACHLIFIKLKHSRSTLKNLKTRCFEYPKCKAIQKYIPGHFKQNTDADYWSTITRTTSSTVQFDFVIKGHSERPVDWSVLVVEQSS